MSWICPFSPTATAAMGRSFISAKRQTVVTHIRDGRAASISPLARSHKNLPKPIWYSTFKSIRHMPIAGWAIPQRLTDRNPWKWLSSCTQHQHTSILLHSSLRVHHTHTHHSPTRSKSGNVNWRIEEDKNPEIREQPKKEKVISSCVELFWLVGGGDGVLVIRTLVVLYIDAIRRGWLQSGRPWP